MALPFDISDRYVSDLAHAFAPLATMLGVPGLDDRWMDLSPGGRALVAEIHASARDSMAPHLDHPDADQALAAQVVHGYAKGRVEEFELGDVYRDLAHVSCSFEYFRDLFDLMDPTSVEGVEPIIERLDRVAGAYAGYREGLEHGIANGWVAAERQVRSVISQAQALGGTGSAYHQLVARAVESAIPSAMVDRLARAVEIARGEASQFSEWLATRYLPHADVADGVGRERFVRRARAFLGADLDVEETYAWGWSEIGALRAEMLRVGAQIDPNASIPELANRLETDPALAAHSLEEFLQFVGGRLDRALAELDGAHFDVPPPIRSVDVKAGPAGAPPGAYYVDSSEDFSRPGTVYYSVGTRTSFPLYQEVSTAYHEGFPGHHLEIGIAKVNAARLSRAQRGLIWYPGFGEGWALYAERLMDELGFFERPEYRFGYLASQLFRASRVVIDIGLHLGLLLDAGSPLEPGSAWSPELGAKFLREVALQPPADAASEVDRYLGWPAQAISYKVGEREILSIREEIRARDGASFDLKAFHSMVLSGGNLPLDVLRARATGVRR